MKNNSIISRVAVIIGLTLGAFTLSALANWTAPTFSPPDCPASEPACNAPINVGSQSQYKKGAFGIGSSGIGASSVMPEGVIFDVFGTGVINKLFTSSITITGGSPSAGKVLTALDEYGNATWQPVSGGGAAVTGPKNYIASCFYQDCASDSTKNIQITVYFNGKVWPHFNTLGKIPVGISFHSDVTTANKICSIIFSDAPYVVSYGTASFSSPSDNNVIIWKDNKWELKNAGLLNKLIATGPITCSSAQTVSI
ncbi:MAG: hypothetical protein WC666_02900 [Candidatus Paceibacterota bacterium]|jgi:hypothetical protein